MPWVIDTCLLIDLAEDDSEFFEASARLVESKRGGQLPKRPIADVLIGAFALRFQGLLTRNLQDFRPLFPTLAIHTA